MFSCLSESPFSNLWTPGLTMFFATCVAFGIAAAPVSSVAGSDTIMQIDGEAAMAPDPLQMEIGVARILVFDGPIETLTIGDQGVIVANVIDPSRIALTPIQEGRTNLLVLGRDDEILMSRMVETGTAGHSRVRMMRGGNLQLYDCADGGGCDMSDGQRRILDTSVSDDEPVSAQDPQSDDDPVDANNGADTGSSSLETTSQE